MGLAENLTKLLESKGVNAVWLASKSGVPTSRISEIVTGKTINPQLKTLQKIADALEVPVGTLTGQKETPTVKEEFAEYGGGYIEAVAAMMREMDDDTKKDIFLSVQKEKLLRELLKERLGKKVG